MKASEIPVKFVIPFANSAGGAYTRAIPVAPQPNGQASLTEGYPPICFLPVGGGGKPPQGQDMNGILNMVSAWNRWYSAGMSTLYDGTFAATIGGYPAGAVLLGTDSVFYRSSVDDNLNDPNVTPTGWIPVGSVNRVRRITASGAFTTLVSDQSIGLQRTSGVTASSTTLPDMAVGQEIWIEDLVGNFQANPVTVTPFAGTTFAGAANAVLNVNRQCARFKRYDNNVWSFKP